MKHIYLIALAALLAGCATSVKVPSNEVTFKSKGGSLTLKHPQNTQMSGVDVEINIDGTVHAKIDKLTTKNDSKVIEETGMAQADILRANNEGIIGGIKAASEFAGTAAGAAGKTMVKP